VQAVTPSPKGIGENMRDWAAFGVSIIALIVSSATAYFTFIRQLDELSAVISEEPSIEYDHASSSVVVYGNLSFLS
jgi:hypothetical protein